jgi:mRNA interferase RelE/StbE
MPEIAFTDAAIDDLRRLGPDVAPRILKKVLILTENAEAGYPLGGELTGFRKLVAGRNTWRIIYRINNKTIEICEIWAIGARADSEVYYEAIARLRAANSTDPQLSPLAKVLEQLGRIAGHVPTPAPARREGVPTWLADRLIRTAGVRREEVAALDLEQAVDRWSVFMSRRH